MEEKAMTKIVINSYVSLSNLLTILIEIVSNCVVLKKPMTRGLYDLRVEQWGESNQSLISERL